jgi:RNA polymerase sigma factor (sigma-70 family)
VLEHFEELWKLRFCNANFIAVSVQDFLHFPWGKVREVEYLVYFCLDSDGFSGVLEIYFLAGRYFPPGRMFHFVPAGLDDLLTRYYIFGQSPGSLHDGDVLHVLMVSHFVLDRMRLNNQITLSRFRLQPEQIMLQREVREHLYRAIRTLSMLQQQVLRLRYGDGLHFGEIAVLLHKREEAVRKLHSRALALLRTKYKLQTVRGDR